MRKVKKLLALSLVVGMSVGLLSGLTPTKSEASMPITSAGQAYDGVDFNTLSTKGNHFYYGAYKHLLPDNIYEEQRTPVLWQIMGEEKTGETGDGNITALSEYVVDFSLFRIGSNGWDGSIIKNMLNDPTSGFIKSFTTEEEKYLKEAEITTIKGNSYEKVINEKTKLYAPSLLHNNHGLNLTWYGKADNAVTEYLGSGVGVGKLKSGLIVMWWTRSPDAGYGGSGMAVHGNGYPSSNLVYHNSGVRPLLKLDPNSIVFPSEIKVGADVSKGETEADGNYVAAVDATKNYKLTILGEDSSKTLSSVPSEKKTITSGDALGLTGLTPSDTSAEYTVNYKIVGTGENGREIVKAGTTPATTSTTLTMDTANLPIGSYDTYVWLQKNNGITSHEAYAVQHFPMTVQPQALKGTVAIDNTQPKIGDVLEGTLEGGNNTGTLNYSWKVNGTEVDLDSTYTVLKADLGKRITLEITSTIETGSLTSTATEAVTKQVAPAGPEAPKVSSKTNHSVTLASQTGYEYSLDGLNWQQSPTFDKLMPAKEYTFYQRLAETDVCQASLISAELKVSTDTPVDPINPNNGSKVNPVPASITNTAVKTGDNSNLLLYISLFLMGLGALTGVVVIRRKQKSSN